MIDQQIDDQQLVDPVADTVQIVMIDQQQFDQLHNDIANLDHTVTWLFVVMGFVAGVHLISAFFQGWRSSK